MPEVTYELRVQADEEQPVEMQIISYDSEGENLGGVGVRLEMLEPSGSFEAERQVTRLDLVTNARGKAYFRWHPWPQVNPPRDAVCVLRGTWDGWDPFVFIERFRETYDGGI
jgi:hypothetical protein